MSTEKPNDSIKAYLQKLSELGALDAMFTVGLKQVSVGERWPKVAACQNRPSFSTEDLDSLIESEAGPGSLEILKLGGDIKFEISTEDSLFRASAAPTFLLPKGQGYALAVRLQDGMPPTKSFWC